MGNQFPSLHAIGVSPESICSPMRCEATFASLFNREETLKKLLPADTRDFFLSRQHLFKGLDTETQIKRSDIGNELDFLIGAIPSDEDEPVEIHTIPLIGSLHKVLAKIEGGHGTAGDRSFIAACCFSLQTAIHFSDQVDNRGYLIKNHDVALRHVFCGQPYSIKGAKHSRLTHFLSDSFLARMPDSFENESSLISFISEERRLLKSEIDNGTIPRDRQSYLCLQSLNIINDFLILNLPRRNEALDGQRPTPIALQRKTHSTERHLIEDLELKDAQIQVYATARSATQIASTTYGGGDSKVDGGDIGEDDIEALCARSEVRIASTRSFRSESERRAAYATLRHQQHVISRLNHNCPFDASSLCGREVEILWDAIFDLDATLYGDSVDHCIEPKYESQ